MAQKRTSGTPCVFMFRAVGRAVGKGGSRFSKDPPEGDSWGLGKAASVVSLDWVVVEGPSLTASLDCLKVGDLNPKSGEVEVPFKRPEKLRKGIEIALEDNEFIKQVAF